MLLLAVRDGARTRLTALPAGPGIGTELGSADTGGAEPVSLAWSPDGKRVALWSRVSVGPQSCGGGVCISRRVVHWRLLVYDSVTRRTVTAADLAADEGASWLAFSPDGRRIGYLLFGQMHVAEVP